MLRFNKNDEIELEVSSPSGRYKSAVGFLVGAAEEILNTELIIDVRYDEIFDVTWGDKDGTGIDHAKLKVDGIKDLYGEDWTYVVGRVVRCALDIPTENTNLKLNWTSRPLD